MSKQASPKRRPYGQDGKLLEVRPPVPPAMIRRDDQERGRVVDAIHTQLECLKYIGSLRDDLPTGEGADVSILLLPELVFDFRAYNLKDEEKPSVAKVCAVGGRAARIACALLHLQDEDDGTYQVHLLAKTGNLGRLLLENEFTRPGTTDRFRHLDMGLLIPRDGQPRCCLIDKKTAEVTDFRPQKPRKEQEISQADLDRPEANRVLKRVKTICITSVTTPDFPGLFQNILTKSNREHQVLFLDITRPYDSIPTLLVQLEHRKAHLLNSPELFLFLPEENQNSLLNGIAVERFCHDYDVGIIQYGPHITRIDRPNESDSIILESDVKFDREDIPERFKAGVLLAHTLYRSLSEVPQSENDLRQRLYSQWSPPSEWKSILIYGLALASTDHDLDGHWPLEQVLRDHGNDQSDHLPKSGDFQALKGATQQARGFKYSKLYLAPLVQDFARLASCRRAANAGRQRPCPNLPICSEPKCPEGCSKTGTGQQGSAIGAVLIDLDSTLIDSTEQRALALLPALRCLMNAVQLGSIEEAAGNFEKLVYDPWPIYKYGLRLGDFRQTWNPEGWYAAFIALTSAPRLATQLLNGWEGRDRSIEKPEQLAKWVTGQAWWSEWSTEFQEGYSRALHEHADAIHDAQSEFEKVQLDPLKESRDFLRSLDLIGAFSLYVVSEGDPETQWLKLKSTGLDAFVKRPHLLTTGDAAEPVEERARLAEERSRLEREHVELEARHRMLDNQLFLLGGIKESIRPWSEEDRMRQRIDYVFCRHMQSIPEEMRRLTMEMKRMDAQLKTVEFAGFVLTRMAKKEGLSFYAAVVRAILRNPESPRDELRSFAHLIDGRLKHVEMKFAMIGDRQSNDVEPPLKLLGPEHVVTIRLLSGNYAKREPLQERCDHPPQFVVTTLAQAKAILLCKDTWDSIKCKGDPPVFNWEIDFANPLSCPQNLEDTGSRIGIHYVLYGIGYSEDEQSITSRVCAGVLAEHLMRSETDFAKVLDSCDELPLGEGGAEAKPIIFRARVLCGLVDAGFHPSSPDLLKQIQQNLADDRRDLALQSPRPGGVLSAIDRSLAMLKDHSESRTGH